MDNLNNVRSLDAIHSAYAALSGAQSSTPQAQVMGAAMGLLLICEGVGIAPSVLLAQAERVIAHADNHYTPNVRAFREYVDRELKGKL